ncbi:lipocalin family protein [Tenacibaculum ovolyticum]|uniref:lipocalin family protein n=1 Tax=Tenacibaculum ovolyticum TaxID=104270 RepID=UPI000417DA92|nr:lipocalin family protein [Tenacibaculum ovolyticum]
MRKIITLIFIITLVSCEKNNQIIQDQDNLLIGNWTDVNYTEGKTSFSKSNSLPENNYGISFKTNGNYKEKTSGWCGTPPLSYFNIEGSYKLENSVITIYKENSSQKWRIISLTETTLVIKRELTAQEIAHEKLMNLFNEIQDMSNKETCSNSSNWSFVGYGAKACGGFKGYITYSKNIDTILFLKKIAAYTKAENEFNKEFGIVSDCSIIKKPTSVVCENNYPTLKY